MPLRPLPRASGFVLAALLLSCASLRAQVQVGSETQLGLNGSVSVGYSSSAANVGPESNGVSYGGVGDLSGSFHSPQFLSFNVAPFFNQSRNNSTYESITDASGVTGNLSIFSGSKFPGYINFSELYNSESSFTIPGIGNYATNGNSQTFGVGWSANLQNLPSLSFGYQQGSSDYSLYGTEQDSTNHYHSVFGNAVYTVDGFHLSGGIHYSNGDSEFPEIVAGVPLEKSSSNSTTYTFNVARNVPLNGNAWFNFARNTTGYDALGFSSQESSDVLTGGVAFKPAAKLSAQFGMDYNDNLAGSILQSVSGTGAITPVSFPEEPSHSWGLYGGAQYLLGKGLYVSGDLTHRQELYQGQSFDSTGLGGSVHYGHDLLGGQFSANATVAHSSYGGIAGQSTLDLLTFAIYTRQFGRWSTSGSFGYSRNQQTTLIGYTSSGYNYSVSLSRPIGRLYWNSSASGAKLLLTQVQGPANFAQAYSTGLAGRWLGASVSYSKSSGTGLASVAGITPLPPGVPPPVVSTITYGGRTYSAGLGSSPSRGLTITASYVNSRSYTQDGTPSSNNKTEQAFANLHYRFRKVNFTAGYSHLLQGFGANGLTPAKLTSYYFGVSRWFKAF